MLSTIPVHQHLLCREQMSPPSLHSVPLHPHTSLQSEGKALDAQRLVWRTCCHSPSKQEIQKKKEPERDQFYEWLVGVLDKKNSNLSWTLLLNPLPS